MERTSNWSNDSFSKNGSISSKDSGSASHPSEYQSRETSFSATASLHRFASVDGSTTREIFSPRHDVNGDTDNYNSVGGQDSISSVNSSPHINSSNTHNLENDSQNQRQEFSRSYPNVINSSSAFMNASSSEILLESAEDTIQELRAEAKTWERNARKLMLDLDVLRMEFSEQLRKQADLDMEVSAAYTERDGLKKEVEKMKILLEESMLKEKIGEDSSFQSKGATRILKEMEDEIKYLRECNENLSMQLERSQGSNIELLSVLQELEDTLEKQKVEIENLSARELEFNNMENSINEKTEENRSLLQNLELLKESEKKLQVNMQLLEQTLEDKSMESVRDSSGNNQTVSEVETEYKCKLSSKKQEITILEAKLSEALSTRQTDELDMTCGSKEDLMREIEDLKERLQEIEMDCSELTNENLELLFKLKDCEGNCTSFGENADIDYPKEELKKIVIENNRLTSLESSKIPDLTEQLRIAFYHVKKPWYNIPSQISKDFDSDLFDVVDFKNTDMNDPKGFADSILNSIVGLNNLLEDRIVQCEEILRNGELEMKERNTQKMVEDHVAKENSLSLSIQELESSNIDLEASLKCLEKELKEKLLEIERLEENLSANEEEIGFLRHSQEGFKSQISDLEKEKSRLEESMEIVVRESNITSKCLDDLRNDIIVLSSSVDSHVSENKILEKRCSELEIQKHELEIHLSNLEKENAELSDRVSGFEAQLRCTIDEESFLLETEKSKLVALSLQDEIRRSEFEMEAQKLNFAEKLQDMQNQCSEAEEECSNLKMKNQKLEVSVESLIEECESLQKANDQLRKQKLGLYEHFTHMEAQLKESQEICSDYAKRIEASETNLSAMLEAFTAKEKIMASEIDALHQENRNQQEKHATIENLLNQTYCETMAEVENLQRERDLISSTRDEKERTASEALHEASTLQASKVKLESDIEELKSKVKLAENELEIVRRESELQVQGLIADLSNSEKKHEVLGAAHEEMLKSLASEEKLMTAINDVELKLTVSEYERQQLIKETANLKVQLQEVPLLHDEILGLKSETEKTEASMRSVSGDCEVLKAEKIALSQQISSLETAISKFEECEFQKVALEEKVVQMERDMSAREIDVTRANKQFQLKIQQLEEEKGECLKKSQALEENLKSMSEQIKGDAKYDDESPRASGVDNITKVQLLENKLAQALEANNKYKVQLQRILSEGRSNHAGSLSKSTPEGEQVAKERYERTKSSLEMELKDLRDRYFQMSLKYAEVEAQKEDLVMKLKAAKNGKKWYS